MSTTLSRGLRAVRCLALVGTKRCAAPNPNMRGIQLSIFVTTVTAKDAKSASYCSRLSGDMKGGIKMSTGRKRGFAKPRGTLPEWVREGGLVYEDTEYPFRYVFTSPTHGYLEVHSEDGSWTKANVEFRKSRRRELTNVLSTCREDGVTALIGWFEVLTKACAIAATGGKGAAHILDDDGRATWCGISHYYALSQSYGVRKTTTDVTKITCRECRTKVINAVSAMPFLVDESTS